MASLKAGQKVASADLFFFFFLFLWLLLHRVHPGQEPSKAPIAGSLPESSGRRTSQPGGKTSQTCASLSALAALSFTGWQMHCSAGEAGSWTRRPPPLLRLRPARRRASQPAHPARPGGPAWLDGHPLTFNNTCYQRACWWPEWSWLSVQGAGGKLLYLLPRGGKSGSCPLGPENSRHVGGSEKEIKRPRGGTLHRPRGWPSSSSLAETAALSLEVSSDLVCPDCKEAVSPHRSGICSFLQAGPFHGMTQPHFSRAGQERPWVKEI